MWVSGPIAGRIIAREFIGRRDRPKKEERTVGTFLDPELLVGGPEEAVSESPTKLAPVPSAARADGLGPIWVHGQDDIVLAFPHPMRFRRSPSRSLIVAFLLCLTLGVALLAGCSQTEGPVIYDLVEQFDVAKPIVEWQQIDFGRPAARGVMREGWFPDDERWNGETPFVWGLGRFSSFDLALVNTRPLTLALEGRPFPSNVHQPGTTPPTAVSVVVNGSAVDTVELRVGTQTYEVEVPAEAVFVGSNRIELRYLHGTGEVQGGNRHTKRVAWFMAELDQALSVDVPRLNETADGLALPFHTGLDFFAKVPSGTSLTIDSLDTWRDAPSDAFLEVNVSIDDSDAHKTVEVLPSWRTPPSVPIATGGESAIVKVSLRARPGTKGPAVGGLTIVGPLLAVQSDEAQARDSTRSGTTVLAIQQPDPPLDRPPNVLVYLIDTLRADHLGAYGYDKGTSPNLDALAGDGILFTETMAQSSWTRSSVASIFTGVHPRSHGVNGRLDSLSPEAATMATRLADGGFATAAYVTNGNVSANFGFDVGFQTFVHLRERKTDEVHVLSDMLTTRAMTWLLHRDTARPFFLYLHATDPHDPYTPRSPFREQFVRSQEFPELVRVRNLLGRHLTPEEAVSVRTELTGLYDAEIAFTDHHFGQLVTWLQEHDLYDSTLIVVTSDHGEEFLDHQQWGYGGTLYQEQLAVPLVIKLPQQAAAGTVIEDLAQHVDLLPTILELAGIEPPATAQGRDLLGPVPTAPDGTSSIQAVSFLKLDGRHAESLRDGWHKAIRYLTPDGTVSRADVFDLESDPGEQNNGALSRAVLRGYLGVELDRSILEQPSLLAAGEGVLDPELEERLRTLGYLR